MQVDNVNSGKAMLRTHVSLFAAVTVEDVWFAQQFRCNCGWEGKIIWLGIASGGNTLDMKQDYDLCYLLMASIELLAPSKQRDIDHPWCYLEKQSGLEDTNLSRKGISGISYI